MTDECYIPTGQPRVAGGVASGTYNFPGEWYLTLRYKF
jgi:hypothetical protein